MRVKLTNGGDSTVNHNLADLYCCTLLLSALPLREPGFNFPPML